MKVIKDNIQSIKINTNTLPSRTVYIFISLMIVFISSVINLSLSADVFASKALSSGLLNVFLAVFVAVLTYVIASITQGNYKVVFVDRIDYLQCINIGLLIGLMLPFNASPYAIVISTIIAIYVSSLIYGGKNYSIFNISVVAALFITLAFSITPLSHDVSGSITSHVPLIEQLKSFVAGWDFPGINYFNLIIGQSIGISMGSSQIMTLLILVVILSIKRIIDYRLALSYLFSVIVLLYLISVISSLRGEFILGHLFSGYLMFAAVFLVTDESTTPTTREGKMIFGFLVALFTVSMRLLSVHSEGLLFAILLSNITVPVLNRTVKRSNFQSFIRTVLGLAILLLFFGFVIGRIGISRFVIVNGGVIL